MPETQNIEYKASWRDEYLKWICGFANDKGEVLVDDGVMETALDYIRKIEWKKK